MAGHGPARKDPSRRVRRNAATGAPLDPTGQPELPGGFPWPEQTIDWWQVWGDSPLSRHFGPTDWAYLLDTALIHADYWAGNLDRASELRQRVAEMERRGRLQSEMAPSSSTSGTQRQSPSQEAASRYASVTPLRAVGD